MNQLPFDEPPADESQPTPNPTPLPSSLPQLLTIREFAKALKLSPRSIWRLVRNQQLPAPVRIGGSIRWQASVVTNWINGGCNLHDAAPNGATDDSPIDEER